MPPGNKKKDPRSNPANFNNTWMPWIKEGEEVNQREGYSITRDEWLEANGLTKSQVMMDELFVLSDAFDEN